MSTADDDRARVSETNSSFYRAFESGDMDALRAIWEQSDRVACTHPGAPTVLGWDAVGASWELLLEAPVRPQFILTEEVVQVVGDVAWVTVVENMLVEGGSGAATAVNWFVRNGERWQMVGHHGASITRPVIG